MGVASETVDRDANGRCIRCEPGEAGELLGLIKMDDPTRRFDGYTDEKATEKKILLDVFAEGDAWFRTGDLLRSDSEGFMYFVDRIGDTFRWKRPMCMECRLATKKAVVAWPLSLLEKAGLAR